MVLGDHFHLFTTKSLDLSIIMTSVSLSVVEAFFFSKSKKLPVDICTHNAKYLSILAGLYKSTGSSIIVI